MIVGFCFLYVFLFVLATLHGRSWAKPLTDNLWTTQIYWVNTLPYLKYVLLFPSTDENTETYYLIQGHTVESLDSIAGVSKPLL